MQSWLLAIMQCPVSGEALLCADAALTQSMRERYRSGSLVTRNGMAVDADFEGGLVNASKTLFFPIRGDIPTLLADEAFDITSE
ncbi:MAG: Trm112 family protein [Pirellulales bacterium]